MVLHRKNALFYKTRRGAEVGDLFMSLIHTGALNEVNPFEYIVALLGHALDVKAQPAARWPPWNYLDAIDPGRTEAKSFLALSRESRDFPPILGRRAARAGFKSILRGAKVSSMPSK